METLTCLSTSSCRKTAAPPANTFKPGTTAGQQFANPKDGAVMVWVPAGKFTMGTDLSDIPEGNREEFEDAPKHTVTLSGYWIYKNDVTVAEYKAFCNATVRSMPPQPPWGWKDDHPMVNVSWHDATAYAKWAGVSLPTEAQWETAARGADGRAYPWGNDWEPARCVHSTSHLGDMGSTKPVGSCPWGASPYGCMDMAGNVEQWCADWYDKNYYNSAPANDPTGPAHSSYPAGMNRVVRGSCWCWVEPAYFRAAQRASSPPGLRNGSVNGFRCSSRPE
jgi:formylglycine-generating enzyme required for sulfatase activity